MPSETGDFNQFTTDFDKTCPDAKGVYKARLKGFLDSKALETFATNWTPSF